MRTPQPAHAIAQIARLVRTTLVIALICSAGIVIQSSPAFAASITVNTPVDESGTGPNCSLREAIQAANTDSAFGGCSAGSGADTIFLASGATYDLGASPLISSTAFGSSAFAITSTITISGGGATLTRSGNASARFFYVSSAGNLTLYNLTVRNGRHVGGNGGNGSGGGGGAAGLGGAIFNEGTLTLDKSTFTGNSAIGGNGGNGSTSTTGTGGGGGGGTGGDGVSVANGSCASPTTGGNGGTPNNGSGGATPTAGGNGGGGGGGNSDSSSGSCGNNDGVNGAVGGFGGGGGGGGSDSSNGNSGNGGNGGYGGGGAGAGAEANNGSAGTAGVGGAFGGAGSRNNSGNDGNGGGGGGGAGLGGVIFNHAGTLVIRNSTFVSNTVTGGNAGTGGSPGAGEAQGGFLFNRNGTVTINNATISGNGNNAIYNYGDAAAATATIRNSIVANTTSGADCFSTSANGGSQTVTQDRNIIRTNTGCGAPFNSGDPLLDSLANNNGSTQTQAIPTTSPAYNAGNNATCETTDQRGVARPQGATCDIGAFELVSSITGLSFVNSSPTRLLDTTFFTATITGGTGVTYTWNFGDGFVTTTGVTTTSRTYAQAGIYTAILTATNFNGITVTTRPVTITNQAPVADAGIDQSVNVSDSVNLNGSGSSDPDNHIPLQYLWQQTGGTVVTLNNASSQSASFTAPDMPAVLTFTLSITDSQGLADPTPDVAVITVGDVAISSVTAQNSSPTRLSDLTYFTATASGSNIVLTWNFGDGSSTVIGANVNHMYVAAGSYTAIVTATNSNSLLSASTAVTVTNDAPVANAGIDQSVNVSASVTLNGSGSNDPDSHMPLQYGWAQIGGASVVLANANTASPSFTAPASPTVLTFTLNVTDALGLGSVAPDEVVITVTDAALSGLAAQSSSPTRLTDATFFTATISAGDNAVYAWDFGDGQTGSGATASHTYTATGNYTAMVTAANGHGFITANTTVTVTNDAPVANAGVDQSVNVNALVMLNGSASNDPDSHTPLTYLWAQTGGPAVTLSDAAAISPTFTAPLSPTMLTFTLRVTDAQQLGSALDEVVVTVGDEAIVGLAAQSSSPTRLTDVTFFTATISAGSNAGYTWDFGDGQTGSGATASHTYTATGNYTAMVTATNAAGLQNATTPVTITNLAPVADASVDQTVSISGFVTLNGLGSSDPDNHLPLAYLWSQTGGPAVTLSSNAAAAPTFTAPGMPAVITFTLLVTDSAGLASGAQDEVVINVIDIGIAGLSAQSSSPTRLTDATFFTATVTSGSGVSYAWDFGDGSPTVAGVNAMHNYTRTGNFIAVVVATNGIANVTASTAVVVTNQAPVPNAGADQSVTVGANVALNGSGIDPDNHLPLSYGWHQIGGTSVPLSSVTSAAASFTAPASPAVLTFTLSVTDAQGLANVAPDTVVITVTDALINGLSAASSSPTRLGSTTFFTASIVAGSNVSYQWNFGDGSPVVNGVTASHVYAQAGNYTALVAATNSAGSQSASVAVAVTNQAPIANAGANQTVSIGGFVNLIGGSSTDPEGHLPLTYRWTQIGGQTVALSNPASVSPSFTAPNVAGTLTFQLVVTDARGLASVPASVVITVKDIGIAGLTAQNNGPTLLGSAALFTATITGGSGVSYVWDFGDGSPTVAGANVSHTYAAAGTYTAVVTATNSNGSVTAQTVVTVNETKKFVYLPIVTRDAR